ncbi:hypothetical protein PspLS_03691 [Pyricularia sp. CBS 133598]|nr:hypothetical protein PspLS_03691 [Pyricularia sp. CBS 133598]
MFDKVAVQKDEQRGGGVGWCGLGTFVHLLESFTAGPLELARLGSQHKFVQSGMSTCPCPLCYCGHGTQNERISNPTKASSMGRGTLSVTCPRVGWRTRPAAGKLHRSRAANFCGTFVCAAAGAALMRTAHVALYFGELSQFCSLLVLIIQLGRLLFFQRPNINFPVRQDPPDNRDVALSEKKKKNAFTKGARTAAVPTS